MKFFDAIFGSKSSESTVIETVETAKAARKAAKTAIENHVEGQALIKGLNKKVEDATAKAVTSIDALLV